MSVTLTKLLLTILLVAIGVTVFAAQPDNGTELNRLLLSLSKKEPVLFGSDSSCRRKADFWSEVASTNLLAVLRKQEGFEEHPLERDRTLWVIPVSTCFSGNRPGYLLVIRDGNKYRDFEGIVRSVENIRVEGAKIMFNETAYAGLCSEYRYLHTFDGKELSTTLLKQIEHCD